MTHYDQSNINRSVMDRSWHLNKDRIDKEMLINQHECQYFLLMLQVVQMGKTFEDSIAKW